MESFRKIYQTLNYLKRELQSENYQSYLKVLSYFIIEKNANRNQIYNTISFFILRVSNFVEWKYKKKTSVMFEFDSKSVIIEAIYAEAKNKSLK